MWEMWEWALDQQRRTDLEAQFADFQAAWPDLSPLPAELRVPSLLIRGIEDTTYDAMARVARTGDPTLVSLDGADHMASFPSDEAREAYLIPPRGRMNQHRRVVRSG